MNTWVNKIISSLEELDSDFLLNMSSTRAVLINQNDSCGAIEISFHDPLAQSR